MNSMLHADGEIIEQTQCAFIYLFFFFFFFFLYKSTRKKRRGLANDIILRHSLLLSARKPKDTCGNSVDLDETARNEPSHQDLHCLPYCFCF